MDFETFVTLPYVTQFTLWLSGRLESSDLRHGFLDRERGIEVSFSGLGDALAQYEWKRCNYQDTQETLREFELRLRTALERNDDLNLRCAAIDVLRWGGVSGGNKGWITKAPSLTEILRSGCTLLSGNDDSKAGSIGRFTAGMSKIYSLLVPEFVIYDSRVAAALAWLVRTWCEQTARASVPDALAFRWLSWKESQTSARTKVRNASSGNYLFPCAYTSSQKALWNMRASWLLSHVLNVGKQSVFHREQSPVRALEAALFMWGYDLRPFQV